MTDSLSGWESLSLSLSFDRKHFAFLLSFSLLRLPSSLLLSGDDVGVRRDLSSSSLSLSSFPLLCERRPIFPSSLCYQDRILPLLVLTASAARERERERSLIDLQRIICFSLSLFPSVSLGSRSRMQRGTAGVAVTINPSHTYTYTHTPASSHMTVSTHRDRHAD